MKNVIVWALIFSAGCALAGPDNGKKVTEGNVTLEQKSQQATENVRQTCYGGKNCTGRVLSHRDRHNCKDKSRGHSWMDRNGRCINL